MLLTAVGVFIIADEVEVEWFQSVIELLFVRQLITVFEHEEQVVLHTIQYEVADVLAVLVVQLHIDDEVDRMVLVITERVLYDDEEVEEEHIYEIQCIEVTDTVEIAIIFDDGVIIVVEVQFLHINILKEAIHIVLVVV